MNLKLASQLEATREQVRRRNEQLDRMRDQLDTFAAKARAVIAEGRPHDCWISMGEKVVCTCSKCVAWDALKALLEEK